MYQHRHTVQLLSAVFRRAAEHAEADILHHRASQHLQLAVHVPQRPQCRSLPLPV